MSTGIGETQVGPSCRGSETNVPTASCEGRQRAPVAAMHRLGERPTGRSERRERGYLAVLVLFCFGFLGVLAFLSISLLCRAGRPVADPDATGPRRSVPPLRRTLTGRMSSADCQRDQVAARPTARPDALVHHDAEGRQQRRGWTASGPNTPADPSRDGKPRPVGRRATTSGASPRRRPPGQPAATPAMAGMTSRPIRSSWSPSSPFMR